MTATELKPLTASELATLSGELKQALISLYGARFDRLILYGSYARGDFHTESDVDFLVVLRDSDVRFGKEIWFMSDVVGTLSHEYNLFISVKPVSAAKFESAVSAFYDTVRKQGKPV